VKCNLEGKEYRVFGYKGKQVRDQIHAVDVVRALHAFIEQPRPGEVYNIGGGRENSASILECIQTAEARLGRPFRYEYVPEHRRGDHICYISNLRKLRAHYPSWSLTRDLSSIWDELLAA